MPQKKTILIYRHELGILPGNESGEAQKWLFSKTEYNERGNMTDHQVFNPGGEIVERVINEYNGQGFLVREKLFTDEEDPYEEKSIERDNNGLITKEYKHYADGSLDTTVYEYDSSYRIVSKTTTTDEDELEMLEILSYRGEHLEKREVFDGEENLILIEEFNPDEAGNTLEHKHWDGENEEWIRTVTTYNANGRKTGEATFNEKGKLIVEILYEENEKGLLLRMEEKNAQKRSVTLFDYDDNGNVTLQVETNDAGEEVVRVERTYNDNGELLISEVFIDGEGRTLNQHYRMELEYGYF